MQRSRNLCKQIINKKLVIQIVFHKKKIIIFLKHFFFPFLYIYDILVHVFIDLSQS